jgi:hypothetical protein
MTQSELNDPLEELARENEVSTKLVERLAEAGLSLRSDRPESPGRISEGLRLLGQYRSLHGRRFRESLEPEARIVAMPGCFEHLDLLDRQTTETDPKWEAVVNALHAYTRGEADARESLARELDTLTQEEYDRIRYEGTYPLSCLVTVFPGEAASRVNAEFDRTRTEAAELDQRIERYLGEKPGAEGTKFAVHCRNLGCTANGEAETFPAENGHLGIRPPAGWKVVPRTPRAELGKVVVDLDFRCPVHPETPGGAGQGPSEDGAGASGANPFAIVDEQTRKCTCCDPIPEDLA